ncbi:MAG TPA: BadF/BadG/BcrA/BcrD ATPase family protein [Candidatus Baltobacteraceae bacterium]|jgi:N-acetylglucosamine kinase-like BadF-type ATPase|nr:BadF/BadG/BcrA/BcrD ATPase family protein [Candidatus Baltobacteraceae bacterium]
MKPVVVVGVDAGGSCTVAVRALVAGESLLEEHRVRMGPANPNLVGLESTVATILAAVRAAAQDRTLDAIHVGVAGGEPPPVAEAIGTALRAGFPGLAVRVGHDALVALRSAIPHGPGIVLIAGTGSVAYAENASRAVRVGGAGYLLGDEGSGFAIGLAACKLAMRVFDSRARSEETSEFVMRTLEVRDRNELIAAIYSTPIDVARIAAIAQEIIALANHGNRAATKIVQTAALDLSELVRSAALQAGLNEASPHVALSGGILEKNSLLTHLLEARVLGDLSGAQILRAGIDPVIGALRLAAQGASAFIA